MSLNTKKQRQHLYNSTFLKWSVERRLSTLEKSTIDSTLSIHNFGNGASEEHFLKFCEALSDFETMIEVAEMTFPALRPEMERIQKQKLTTLKKRSLLQNKSSELEKKAEAIKEKALNLPEIIKKQESEKIKSKGLKKLFGL